VPSGVVVERCHAGLLVPHVPELGQAQHQRQRGAWRPMPDGAGDAFTLLTTEPSSDLAPIHERQMVVLDRSDWLAWLDLTKPESELLRPLPAGSLAVKQVRYPAWPDRQRSEPGPLCRAGLGRN